jgi:GTP 3',8-cyclase
MLIDPYNREINYLRLSVTDRCNFRCRFCMSEKMTFLPRKQTLDNDEMLQMVTTFTELGVKHLRITGGEPLIRPRIKELIESFGQLVANQRLETLSLSTNGTHLPKFAETLAKNHCKRINVSLETLDPEAFKHVSRNGKLHEVLTGIQAAQEAGLEVKINSIFLPNTSDDAVMKLINWAAERNLNVTFIEMMPIGQLDDFKGDFAHPCVSQLLQRLKKRLRLTPKTKETNGPSRYHYAEELGIMLGFITPLSNNFCHNCNRVRLTCNGHLYPCLGDQGYTDLGQLVKNNAEKADIVQAIHDTIAHKPKEHHFQVMQFHQSPYIKRHMNVTGG